MEIHRISQQPQPGGQTAKSGCIAGKRKTR